MAVLRIHKKQQNYVILDKTCLNDDTLTWTAKGLHAYLMSLPDNWQIRVSDLQKRANHGRDAVRATLKELELAGYIIKSSRRDSETGRFSGIEYLVLEIPESETNALEPEPEKPFAVNPRPRSPAPGNPSPDKPTPEKTTLINNNYNNKLNKQGLNITAAASNKTLDESVQHEKSAVVFSFPKHQRKDSLPAEEPLASPLIRHLQDDALIGQALTQNQLSRVGGFVYRLDSENRAGLIEEIQYTLLNKACFTGCGNDFSKKFNAIRNVILRGDWQTPASMANECLKNTQLPLQALESELRDAQAEMAHFQRLLVDANEGAKQGLEEIVNKTRLKIKGIKHKLSWQASRRL